jgi:hypothetical protein
MANRKDRRAQAAAEQKLPAIPNLSGDSKKSCGQCHFTIDPAVHKKVIAALQNRHDMLGGEAASRPVQMTDNKVVCIYNAGGGAHMFTYGICSHFLPKEP